MIKKPDSNNPLLNPPLIDQRIDLKKEEASKKIYRFMSEFQLRKKGFHSDLKYLRENIQESKTEKHLMNFLQRQLPFIEFYVQKKSQSSVQKNTKEFFSALQKTHTEKDYRITGVKEGLYGRKIPEVDIVPKKYALGTILHFVPHIESDKDTKQEKPVQSKAESDYLVQCLSKIQEIPWNYKFTGCQYKTTAACQLLQHMGVPGHTLKKIWAFAEAGDYLKWTSQDDTPDQYKRWRWHIAPILTTTTQEKYVIDPSLNPNQALSLEEWKSQIKAEKPVRYEEVELSCLAPGELPLMIPQSSLYEGDRAHTFMYFHRQLALVPFKSSTRELLNWSYPNEIKRIEDNIIEHFKISVRQQNVLKVKSSIKPTKIYRLSKKLS